MCILTGILETKILQSRVDQARQYDIPLLHIPQEHGIEHAIADQMRYAGLLGRHVSSSPLQGWRNTLKRAIDIL